MSWFYWHDRITRTDNRIWQCMDFCVDRNGCCTLWTFICILHIPIIPFGGKIVKYLRFGGNRGNKPPHALKGHYWLVSPVCDTSTANLYLVLFLRAAETLRPPTLITGLDFIGLRLPLILGPCLCMFLVVAKDVTID